MLFFSAWKSYLTMQDLSSQYGILHNLTQSKSLYTNPNARDQYLPEYFRKLFDSYNNGNEAVIVKPLVVSINYFIR